MTHPESSLVDPEGDASPSPSGRRRHRGLVLAAVAAAVLIVVFLLLLTDQEPLATDDVQTPAANTVGVPPPLPELVVDPDAPPDLVTSLGRLTWTDVSADGDLVPFGEFQVDPLRGGYVGYGRDGGGLRSEDGLVWVPDTTLPPSGQGSFVQYVGDIALVNGSGRGAEVFELADGSWVRVRTDDLILGGIAGLQWGSWAGRPVSSDGVLVIPVTVVGSLPLNDIYGTRSDDCNRLAPCETWLWSQWSRPASRIIVYEGSTNQVVATLDVVATGNEVALVDSGTEETVHVITFPSTAAATGYLDGLNRGASISKQVVYVKDGVQDLDVYDAPWDDAPLLGPVPGGFVAFESIEYPAGTLQGFPVTWRSTDGFNWTETGSPDFLPDRYQHITVFPLDDTLIARVVISPDPSNSGGTEEWVSPDGMGWTQREPVLPGDAWAETDFGFVATGRAGGDRLWVSGDGGSWEEVALPASQGSESWLFSYGGVGDILYYEILRRDGTTYNLWIGRFAD